MYFKRVGRPSNTHKEKKKMIGKIFQNRVSSHPNRRVLSVIRQEGDKLVVDIARSEDDVVTKEGTAIDAQLFNDWNDEINSAVAVADSVKGLFTNAPDCTLANGVGTPSVSIVGDGNGGNKLSFRNLKGERGEKGEAGTEITVDGEKKQRLTFELSNGVLNIVAE